MRMTRSTLSVLGGIILIQILKEPSRIGYKVIDISFTTNQLNKP